MCVVLLLPAISKNLTAFLYGWLPLSNAYGISFTGKNMKNSDKNLSEKSGEREVKNCKIWFFTLHPSFFILRKHRFRSTKGKLWPRQRLCLVAWNITFHTTKHGLSRNETLPLANLLFVNCPFTDEYPCNHLSFNTLRKTSKNGVFSTEWPFRSRRWP